MQRQEQGAAEALSGLGMEEVHASTGCLRQSEMRQACLTSSMQGGDMQVLVTSRFCQLRARKCPSRCSYYAYETLCNLLLQRELVKAGVVLLHAYKKHLSKFLSLHCYRNNNFVHSHRYLPKHY